MGSRAMRLVAAVGACALYACAGGSDGEEEGFGKAGTSAGSAGINGTNLNAAGVNAAGFNAAGVSGAGLSTAGTDAPVGGAAAAPPVGGNAGVMPIGGSAGVMPLAGIGAAAGMQAVAGMMAPMAGTGVTGPRGDGTCLAAGSGQYGEPGPYKVGQMDVSIGSSGMFTVFYPDPMEAACPHPIVAWGNGTGVTGSATYGYMNSNAASWGMVVVASHESNTGSGAFHKAGLDWLLAQNGDASSIFHQKLSTRAGVSGHSQGGIGANAGSSHPNVETAAITGMSMTATAKVSVLVLTGTADIVQNVEASVPRAGGPMFVGNWEGGDHVVTETIAGYISRDAGALAHQRLYGAWFRCFLADDNTACALFEGAPDNCGVCKDPGWHALAGNF